MVRWLNSTRPDFETVSDVGREELKSFFKYTGLRDDKVANSALYHALLVFET